MRQIFYLSDLTEMYCVYTVSMFIKLCAETDEFENIETVDFEVC